MDESGNSSFPGQISAAKIAGSAALTTPDAVSANTAAGYVPSALAVKQMANNTKVYVGSDGKLHFKNAWGADTALNFSSGKMYGWYGSESVVGIEHTLKIPKELQKTGTLLIEFASAGLDVRITNTVTGGSLDTISTPVVDKNNYGFFKFNGAVSEIKLSFICTEKSGRLKFYFAGVVEKLESL